MEKVYNSWKEFWDNYRNLEPKTEADLYFQVGKTVNKKPIEQYVFRLMLARIEEHLALSKEDCLLDFCCGNGIISYEIAKRCRRVIGVDFAQHLILAARKLKKRSNITYQVGDVTGPLKLLVGDFFPTKFLMNDSLAYFEPENLERVIVNISQHLGHHPFRLLLTNIPNFDLKWHFYNTPERRYRHLENEKQLGHANDGLGRWWRTQEIETICSRHGLNVNITNQPNEVSNYRMDALIMSPVTS